MPAADATAVTAVPVATLLTAVKVRSAVRILAAFVADERAMPTPEVVAALDVYIAASRWVNDRLGECHRLVRLGQRSEALRQVQLDPDALVMYGDLRFKGVELLPEDCDRHKLPVPPPLDTEAATWLNEAYKLEKEQQDILREHRRLALGRAPLRRRLEVLRIIEKQSAKEAFWQDDVAQYEQKRIEEIRTQLADAKVRNDWDAVQGFYKEAKASTATRTPFPIEVVDAIKKARKRLIEKAAGEVLQPLIAHIGVAVQDKRLRQVVKLARQGAALGKEDVADVTARLDRLEAVLAQAEAAREKYDLAKDSELMDPVHEAAEAHRKWAADLKRWREFRAALKELQTALRDNLDWYYIDQYYVFATQYGMPLPEEIATVFRQRSRSRRRYWIIGTGVAVLVAVAAAVAFLVRR